MTDTERRLAYWREKLPLDPIVTEVRCRRVMFLRAEWVRTHPLGNALSDWPKAEHEHFAAVGRLLEEYSSWTVALGEEDPEDWEDDPAMQGLFDREMDDALGPPLTDHGDE